MLTISVQCPCGQSALYQVYFLKNFVGYEGKLYNHNHNTRSIPASAGAIFLGIPEAPVGHYPIPISEVSSHRVLLQI